MLERPTPPTAQFLCFRLAGESCAVTIQRIDCVIGPRELCTSFSMPGFLCGVVELSGDIVPVVDLRIHIGLREPVDTSQTRIVIFRLLAPELSVCVGGVVDQVDGVELFRPEAINRSNGPILRWPRGFVVGTVRQGAQCHRVLDIENVLAGGVAGFSCRKGPWLRGAVRQQQMN
jgi:purine-binding chemotaxis protein CheW